VVQHPKSLKKGEGVSVRFSRPSFRVILIPVCALFLAVCASARSDASLPGAVMDSGGLAFRVPLKTNAVKEQVEAISIWNALRQEDAGSLAITTSQQI
jgi:hypothetical protein